MILPRRVRPACGDMQGLDVAEDAGWAIPERKSIWLRRSMFQRMAKSKRKMELLFNPFLKTKLVGVLGSSFLKVQESPYKDAYYNYKARLEKPPQPQGENKRASSQHGNALCRQIIFN